MGDSRVEEIADGIYRVSTCLPHAVGDRDLTINQFLVLADEPVLFHTGLRASFKETAAAVARCCRSSASGGCPSGTSRRTSAGP